MIDYYIYIFPSAKYLARRATRTPQCFRHFPSRSSWAHSVHQDWFCLYGSRILSYRDALLVSTRARRAYQHLYRDTLISFFSVRSSCSAYVHIRLQHVLDARCFLPNFGRSLNGLASPIYQLNKSNLLDKSTTVAKALRCLHVMTKYGIESWCAHTVIVSVSNK